MTDIAKTIKAKFTEKNRYSNFGSFLRKINIHGFRGINDLNVEIEFPITAISGLNGAGKSTIGQIAICGYKKPKAKEYENYKRLYIKDFFPVSTADPAPIANKARIIFTYETDDYKKAQDVTVSRKKSAWSGYTRQPERCCFYVGFTVYIPKVERRDLSIYGGVNIEITEKREIDKDTVTKMARIIGHKYDSVNFQGVSHKGKELEIGIASRLGNSYSENNMGFGEGRILYIVDLLEKSPRNSLFILEEPETSLHESAQHEFAKYLLDVCNRKHHQIILSTHSSAIINALPLEARKLLLRDENGVEIKDKISSSQLRSILSDGHSKGLDICVEDVFAKVLLTEMIRAKNKSLLKTIAIHDLGSKDAVRIGLDLLLKANKKAIAVRDADVGQHKIEKLYSFPGSMPPEKEVFNKKAVKDLIKTKYGINFDWLIEKEEVKDHHKYAKCIADDAQTDESVIRTLAIEKYISEIGSEFDELIEDIEREINN